MDIMNNYLILIITNVVYLVQDYKLYTLVGDEKSHQYFDVQIRLLLNIVISNIYCSLILAY